MTNLRFITRDRTVTETTTGLAQTVRAAGQVDPISFLITGNDGGRLRVDCRYYTGRFSGWSFEVGIPANDNDFKFPEWDIKQVRSEDRSYLSVLEISSPVTLTVTRILPYMKPLPPVPVPLDLPNETLRYCLAVMLNMDILDVPKHVSVRIFKEWLIDLGYGIHLVPGTEPVEEGTYIGLMRSKRYKYPVAILLNSEGHVIYHTSNDVDVCEREEWKLDSWLCVYLKPAPMIELFTR